MNHPTSLSKFKASFIYKDNEKWDIYWQSLKHTIPGTEQQKQSTLRKRVLKFFKDFKIDQQTCYNQRRDAQLQNNQSFKVCSDVLLLYGTDYLQNQKIKEYFSPYECEIKKIDYSHSLVCFSGQNQNILYALFQHLIDKPADVNMLIQFFSENNKELITWREISGYKQLCFDKKLWARFITQREGQQIHNQTFQSKDLQTYELVKQEFMEKMDKIYKKKNVGINNNYSKKPKEKQCSCCQIKLNKLKEMLTCCHTTKHGFNFHNKKRYKQRSRERSRSRDYQKKKKPYQFNSLPNILDNVQPLRIVKNITDPNNYQPHINKKEKLEKMNRSSSFISKIDKQKNEEEEDQDQLFRDMLISMQKYDPFAEGPDVVNMSISSKLNTSKYSVYEQFSEDDET